MHCQPGVPCEQVCTLRSEARPPDEAFNPTVKRSGWKAPEETGLWDTANEVKDQASTVFSTPCEMISPKDRSYISPCGN